MDYLIAIASLVVALTAVRGKTWDDSKTGIRQLTPVGWIAIVSAILLSMGAIGKTYFDGLNQDALKKQIAQIATNSLISLTQELSNQDASMQLTPRVALFAATAIKTGDIDKITRRGILGLAEALLFDIGTIEDGDAEIRLFDNGLVGKQKIINAGNPTEFRHEGALQFLYSGRINDQATGPLAFSLVARDTSKRETVKVVGSIFDKKGEVELSIKVRTGLDADAIAKMLATRLGSGFGYFFLSSSARPVLCFTLEPQPVKVTCGPLKSIHLLWRVGTIGGIRTQGCNLG